MPNAFFEKFPVTQYGLDSGNEKVVVDILRRVKLNASALLDGAIFYNYTMQDSDTPEIIAHKYYGSSQYHWVVMLMNSVIDHVYDFALDDTRFENYMKSRYGTLERSFGVTVNLTDEVQAGRAAGITSESYSGEQRPDNNSALIRGTIPKGNSTGIYIRNLRGNNPWGTTIDIGDVVDIFVPETWYLHEDTTTSPVSYPEEYQRIPYTFPAEIVAISERVDPTALLTHSYFYLSTNMNSSGFAPFTWDAETEDVWVQTGISHFERDYYNSSGVLLSSGVHISKGEYVNTSIGTASTKRIVTNYDHDYNFNEEKRTIYLLKKEYLSEFVEEFESLITVGVR